MTKLEKHPLEIGILSYPGAQLAAIYGLTDLFQIASRMEAQLAGDKAAGLRISHWISDAEGENINSNFDTHPHLISRPTYMILPPSLGTPLEASIKIHIAQWLKSGHANGMTLCSICAGAFLLAETGLLDGRSATTHWIYADTLAQQFPAIKVDVDKLIIDDGDIVTAGGLMAWTDLGLKLVEKLLGPTVTVQTARFLLIDPVGREQRHYSSFAPRLHHGDAAILKVQHWLQAKGAKDVSLETMTAQAGMEKRTFLRRFHAATGLRPTEYCQHLRVGKAREALEFTNNSIDQIAWQVGYVDPGAFRKVFQKIVGLSPGDYRRRFGVSSRL